MVEVGFTPPEVTNTLPSTMNRFFTSWLRPQPLTTEAPLAVGGWHLMGTARMGTDPERSVVNEWGRSHDVKNLFIVDGSIWVTSGGVNPTSTIQALALYIADNIKRRLADATLFD